MRRGKPLRGRALAAITDLRSGLAKLYGPRLRNVILYGSWARGEANADSDIDLAIVLDGRVMPFREIDRMGDILTDIDLEYGVLLSVYPVSRQRYHTVRSPLLSNVRREGIAI
jgi:predicted nucleotidyltransferase